MNTATKSHLLLALTCTVTIASAANQATPTKASFSRKLIASVEQTVNAVKKNPECLDDIDNVVDQVQKEVKHISQELKKTVSPEQLKALGKAVKQETDHLERVIKATVEQSAKRIDTAIDTTVAPQQKADLIKKASTSVKNIETTCRNKETAAHFKKLGNDLKAAGQTAAESVTVVAQGLDEENEEVNS
jgi:exonuclease VII large subunit